MTSYEAGMKTNIGRLRLNLAAFQAEDQDIQLIFAVLVRKAPQCTNARCTIPPRRVSRP